MDEHKQRLSEALGMLQCVHPEDVVSLPSMSNLLEAMTSGGMNAATAALIVKSSHPNLFADFAGMSDQDFNTAETALREGTRSPNALPANAYSDIDASQLNADELNALEHALRGNGSSVDRPLLERARQRQRGAAK